MTTAYVALGANLGDRLRTIRTAIDELARYGSVVASSSVYETDPVGYADQPSYLNAVVALDTELGPEQLLAALLSIEARHGRERAFRNAPRTLDLDLLLFGQETIASARLTVPHPRLHERAFVLVPLAEIAPGQRVPGLNTSVSGLLDRLGPVDGVRRYPEPAPTDPP